MDALNIERFHLVGAKIGGVIGRVFAARRHDRVATLTIAGSPPPVRADADTLELRVREVEEQGVEHWARRSMGSRLGKTFPAAGVEWWIQFMSRMPVSSGVGFLRRLNFSNIADDIPKYPLPDIGHHYYGKRTRHCRPDPRLAAADSGLGTSRITGRFFSRRGNRS